MLTAFAGAGMVIAASFGHTLLWSIAPTWHCGTQTARYVHGPGTDEPLISYSGTGLATRSFYHADERGSVVAISDDAGAMSRIFACDEYGNIAPRRNRFEFTGYVFESVSGLLYARARMYNPKLGRFMQADPIGYDDGMNMYTYVKGDPVNFTDPTGLEVQGPEIIVYGFSSSGASGEVFRGTRSGSTTADLVRKLENLPLDPSEEAAEDIVVTADRGVQTATRLSKAIEGLKRIYSRLKPAAKPVPPRPITWKYKQHSLTRLQKKGIDPAKAQDAVKGALDTWSRQVKAGDTLRGSLKVDGKWIEYRANVRPDGSISVGTIFPL
ncbi:MAG: RHS repeat-associated core domain-containing protein [Pseudomonadota bacterium]|nr:RHS repeat-associated core domain-containing protein [Pseudomonadota bacterium]